MTIKKLTAVFTLVLALVVAGSSYAAFAENCAAVRAGSVRLHIIANSDTEEDQALKLALRDAMLTAYSPRLAETGPEAAREAARSLCAEMEAEAARFMREHGCNYTVAVSVVDMYFATSYYESFTMPAGMYTALRFEIGEAAGRNWWCVMYPPLCIPAASEGQAAEIEGRIAALNEPVLYKPAFAVVEAVEKLKVALGGE